MTDRDLVAKKLAVIETCVRELRALARPAEVKADVREERFVEHTSFLHSLPFVRLRAFASSC